MLDHWEKSGPPVYMSVAGYLGLTKTSSDGKTSSGTSSEYGNLEELERMFAGSGGVIK